MSARKYSSISPVCDFVTNGDHRYFYMTLQLWKASQKVIYHHFKINILLDISVSTERQIYYRIIIFQHDDAVLQCYWFRDRMYSILQI